MTLYREVISGRRLFPTIGGAESPNRVTVMRVQSSQYQDYGLRGSCQHFPTRVGQPQSVSVSDRIYVCHDTVSKPNAPHQVVRT
jgi:hypothetical protein